MRDDDLARKAHAKGFVTAEQLREAREFAAGGRSLLSVLLDLGHLKPDDLLRLGEAPPPPRLAKLPWILIGAAPIAALLIAALWSKAAVAPPEPPSRPPERSRRFAEQAVDRARNILERIERKLDARGRPPAQADVELRRAAALLEEALADETRPEDVLLLARARELLDEWELALDLYRRVLEVQPGLPTALLGAARVDLLLQKPAEARAFAEQACNGFSPPPEAYFLRGAAAHALGDFGAANGDLARALELDASLAPRVRDLRGAR